MESANATNGRLFPPSRKGSITDPDQEEVICVQISFATASLTSSWVEFINFY